MRDIYQRHARANPCRLIGGCCAVGFDQMLPPAQGNLRQGLFLVAGQSPCHRLRPQQKAAVICDTERPLSFCSFAYHARFYARACVSFPTESSTSGFNASQKGARAGMSVAFSDSKPCTERPPGTQASNKNVNVSGAMNNLQRRTEANCATLIEFRHVSLSFEEQPRSCRLKRSC